MFVVASLSGALPTIQLAFGGDVDPIYARLAAYRNEQSLDEFVRIRKVTRDYIGGKCANSHSVGDQGTCPILRILKVNRIASAGHHNSFIRRAFAEYAAGLVGTGSFAVNTPEGVLEMIDSGRRNIAILLGGTIGIGITTTWGQCANSIEVKRLYRSRVVLKIEVAIDDVQVIRISASH